VEEFSANNYGTDEILDNAFGVLQYDANWKSDTSSQGQGKGYLAMIPKFLKCQRIFQPTPLSTLQKLTVRLERPDGTLIDDHMDTFNIADIIEGTALPNPGSHYYSSSGGPSEFIALKMSKFFSHFAAQRGDRVIFQNFTVIPNTTGLSASDEASILSAADDLMRFINREEGHLVCDVGYDSGSGYVSEGWNSVGYSNYIVIRSKYADPETGSTAPDPFGGSVIMSELMFDKVKGTVSDGVGMNMMRQTQLVFRIITRELDSTTHIRPDNK
jgi:hypothetical protein